MSRPYININSATYNSQNDVITLDITALRLRGQEQITIAGLSDDAPSQQLTLTDGYYSNSSLTFSANINGTSSIGNAENATFTPATSEFTFSGEATFTTKTNVKIRLWPGPLDVFGAGGYTFSATQSDETAVETLKLNATNLPTGVVCSRSGNTLIFTAPEGTGAYYNGNDAYILSAAKGSSSFTFSSTYYTQDWSGGVTTLTLSLTSSSFGVINTSTFNVE